jgi:tetratricopeptide (TPR) repeat protein
MKKSHVAPACAALICLALAACSKPAMIASNTGIAVPASPDAASAVAAPGADPTWPLDPQRYRTTSGAIYLGNLDARIEELGRSGANGGTPEHRVALARSLYQRYQVVGRIADAEAAMREVEAALAAPRVPAEAHALHAILLVSFHRFDEAEAALAAAEDAGADAEGLRRTRVEMQLARGDYASLRGELDRSTEIAPDFHLLAHRADLRLQLGDPAGAAFLYRAAQSTYRDVNPVPLAWLHVQQGIAWLRQGEVAKAREFFAAAHARLPQYYLATEHLAECEARLGRLDEARRLYRAVIAQTGNPEFIAALSGVERDAGDADEAERLAQEAERGFEALLARHPSAAGQHAAEFFIERGQAERADALARDNLVLRQDVGSLILLAQTAQAVGDTARACEARARALDTGLRPPELGELDALGRDCG